jgi:FixJ family two-component response regulator
LAKLLFICVVDDDENVREALADTLVGSGYSASTFASGYDLLNFPRLQAGDCFVSDYNMPEMDGVSLCRELRDRGYDQPFILMTAFATERLRTIALSAGAACVLEKPFEPEELVTCVENVLP